MAWPATIAALLFVAAAGLPTRTPSGPGLALPIFWPVMPFAAWAAGTCVVVAVYSGFQLLSAEEGQGKVGLRLLLWSLASLLFFGFFKWQGDQVHIVTGRIPMSATVAVSLIVIGAAAVAAMAVSARTASRRGFGRQAILHIALVAGSIVFGLPFFWLVVTSFKEDVDMSSPKGLVWIPRVSETASYRDPLHPYYEGVLNGQTVLADLIAKEPDGRLKLNVSHPLVLLGQTFEAYPSQMKEVPRQVPVVTGTHNGEAYTGEVVEEMPDGNRRVLITAPEKLKGTSFVTSPLSVKAVRHVGLNWSNYPSSLEYLPREANYGLTYLENTLLLVIFNVIGTIASSALVAYAFARMRFPGRNVLFFVLLSTMMLPAAVTLLPTFLIFRSLGWIDTLYPLWVPAFFASAFNVFLLRQFFLTIPKELEDASKIDGCSHPRTFWSIMLPQVKPALAVITIWTFMGVWNNFMGPLVYISSPEHMTVAYSVQLFQSDRGAQPGLLMAFATMSMIPVLILFFTCQKYFIEGVTITGLGGR